MELWRDLRERNPAIPVRPCPALDWDFELSHLDDMVAAYNRLGYRANAMTRDEISHRFPALRVECDRAIHCEQDAVVTPEFIAGYFRQMATDNGTRVLEDSEITGFRTRAARISGIEIGEETIACDHVVIAAGCASVKLLSMLNITLPLDNRAGLLVRTSPVKTELNALVSAPDIHFWQMDDGRIIAGKNQAGEYEANNLELFAGELLKRLNSLLPLAEKPQIENHTLGTRPQPVDGMPVLDRCEPFDNLHLAVLHSGITLATVVARYISEEITSDTPCDAFAPYRLNRFENQQRSMAS